jgi:hypothetical protein
MLLIRPQIRLFQDLLEGIADYCRINRQWVFFGPLPDFTPLKFRRKYAYKAV